MLTVDTSVGSVGTSASLLSALDGDVPDVEFVVVDLLGLGVGLDVAQEVEDLANRFFGPASLAQFELLSLSSSADSTVVATERDASLVKEDILKI